MGNVKNSSDQLDSDESNKKGIASVERYISALEPLTHPGHLLYVPGNHDSAVFFNK